MSWNLTMHILGWLCLIGMAATAIVTIVETVRPQWRRILSLAAGNIEPEFATPPPARAVRRAGTPA